MTKKEELDQETEEVQEEEQTKKTSSSVIDVLKKDKIETKVVNLKELIKLKLDQLRDIATIEHLMPIDARLKNRMKSIKELSSAQHIKIEGQWKTTKPQMFITKLEGKKISNDEAHIIFEVYETNKEGNKVIKEHSTKVKNARGETFDRITSAEYVIGYRVKEILKHNKPISKEIIQLGK